MISYQVQILDAGETTTLQVRVVSRAGATVDERKMELAFQAGVEQACRLYTERDGHAHHIMLKSYPPEAA